MSKDLGAHKLLRKFVTCQIILKVRVDYYNTLHIERMATAVLQGGTSSQNHTIYDSHIFIFIKYS